MAVNVRQLCLDALLEWEKGKIFSDEILHQTLARTALVPLDRAFLMETFFGVLRNLSRLDFYIEQLREGSLESGTRAVLRLGLYQIFQMRTAAHAAVHETVDLGGRARGLVNAVLRRALREKDLLEKAADSAEMSIAFSHPEFLLARWRSAFGEPATRALCLWNNTPAEVYARVNGLKTTRAALLAETSDLKILPSETAAADHPRMLRLAQIPPAWLRDGLCYIQDPSTLLAVDLLDPKPGEKVLDACAAPGGKTTYLAELMENSGEIIACDLYDSRVARLRENLQRLGVTNTRAIRHDCMQAGEPLRSASFDAILVDAPCSNTGVIRRRVDVRWRLSDEDFLRMPAQQFALIRRTATLLKPGGVLVYSTCSLEAEENEGVVQRTLEAQIELRLLETRRHVPFLDGVDGAFAAKFIKEKSA